MLRSVWLCAFVMFLAVGGAPTFVASAMADDDGRPAATMMKAAHEGRAMWERFPGFKAKVRLITDAESVQGTVEVDAEGQLKLSLENGAKAEWADRTLGSVVSHRRATSDFESAVEFADQNTSHPLGRLIKSTAASDKSLWRVKDDVLTEIHRFGATSHFVISVAEVWRNSEGKHLPRSFTVTTWDDSPMKLKSTRQVYNEWKRMGAFDLPTKLLAINCSADGSRKVEQIELSAHELLGGPVASAASR